MPVIPGTEAVGQEVDALRTHFGGDVVWLRPSWRGHARYPKRLVGAHHFRHLRRRDEQVDLHHVFAGALQPLPIIRLLRKPVVYTVAAGVGPRKRWPRMSFLKRLAAIVVQTQADLECLTAHGLTNGYVIRSGIDVDRFVSTAPPTGPDFVLLLGSAPWTRTQFRSKGVDVLLETLRVLPQLRVVFLWRGVLLDELVSRVRKSGVSDRVEILSERVDVAQVLQRVHAAVVISDHPGSVKAHPHSLMEALAAGRPLLISKAIGMADYVRETGCGCVVEGLSVTDLSSAIEKLIKSYDLYRSRTAGLAERDFSIERFVADHQKLYRTIVG